MANKGCDQPRVRIKGSEKAGLPDSIHLFSVLVDKGRDGVRRGSISFDSQSPVVSCLELSCSWS